MSVPQPTLGSSCSSSEPPRSWPHGRRGARPGAGEGRLANDRIRLALLARRHGSGRPERRSSAGVELVAAADIYDGRFEECRKKFGKDVQTTRDYREILAARTWTP